MKLKLPKELLNEFIASAIAGSGRETDAGGGNTQVDQTVLKSEVEKYPELAGLAGGTIRVYLNQDQKYVGHKVIGPRPKRLDNSPKV